MATRQDLHSLRHSSEEEKSVQEIVTHTGNGNAIVQLAEDYMNNRTTLPPLVLCGWRAIFYVW